MQTIEIDGQPHLALSIEDVEMLRATLRGSGSFNQAWRNKVDTARIYHNFLNDPLVVNWIKKNRT